MTDKVQKIRKEVEKLKKLADAMYYAAQYLTTDASRLHKAMEEYHQFIINKYHKEEPVSEELEEAAKAYSMFERSDDTEVGYDLDRYGGFIAGAQWDKEQMMAKAIDGYVIEDIEEGNGDFLLSAEYIPKSMDLKDRQKVKVIVIRED